MFRSRGCTHRDQILITEPSVHVCEDCVKNGDKWVHLRLCVTCGYVGCCDSSRNRHASKHYRTTGHPIMRSIEPGEDWMWCFVDQGFVE